MRSRLTALIALVLATPVVIAADATTVSTPAEADAVVAAQAVIRDFSRQLQGELKTALAQGGPPAAITVCQKQAPVITDALSAASGWQLRRVSLKPRKPVNMPDEWERAVLHQFEQQLAAGADPKQVIHSEVVPGNAGAMVRVMQAIPTGEVCLVCHGDKVSPEVSQALATAYPDDQARGYTLGQLRGAFSLSKPVPAAP